MRAVIRSGAALLTLVAAVTTAGAQDAQAQRDMKRCAAMSSDQDRLKCFDALAKETPEPPPASGVTTKEAIAPAPPTTYRVVDPVDFHVAPRKFLDQGVELRRVSCFHADKNEYRCMNIEESPVVVFAPTIEPAEERQAIENACGQFKTALQSPRCRRTIRFVPQVAEIEKVNALISRLVVVTRKIEAIAPAPERRKRR